MTASNPSTTGFTVTLSPVLNGLKASNFGLLDSSNNPVTMTGVVTTDNGATYTISAALSGGQTYTVTASKTGYDFGTAQNVVVPAISEILMVSNPSTNGIYSDVKSGT